MATDTAGQPLCTVASDNFLTNSAGQSPCDVAAALYAACGALNFKINPLQPNNHYTPGDATLPPSQCSCSWAAYNTLMGCSACQADEAITNSVTEWGFFISNCSATDLSTSAGTWFPPSLTIPNNTRVPYWAQQDPTKWTETRFNITEAYGLASSNNPDATQATTSTSSTASSSASTTPPAHHSSSPPIGAIAGGAVGGVVVLCAIAVLIWYKCFRRPKHDHQGVFGAPLRVRGTGFGDETPSPGSVMKPGVLGMTTQMRLGHHTQISNDSTVVMSDASYVGYPPGQRPLSDVSLNNTSASHNVGMSVDMTGLGHQMDYMPRPFIPLTSPDGVATSTPTRKGREAAREREENGPPSAFARRFNPPTYENALEASAASSSRPAMSHSHSHSAASDASSRGNASQTELSLSLSGIPTLDGHTPSDGVLDSPTTTNVTRTNTTGTQPPGLGLRLVAANAANARRDTDGYFGDRKDRES